MAKRKNIMAEWKEFNPLAEKSIKDDFGESPSPDCQKIISYLENCEVKAIAPSRDTDVITEDIIFYVYKGEKTKTINEDDFKNNHAVSSDYKEARKQRDNLIRKDI